MRLSLALAMLLVIFAPSSTASSYLILPDGSGDFPTIQDAIDATVYGDTILLGDGVFTGEGNSNLQILGGTKIIQSHSGQPTDCIIDCDGARLSRTQDGITKFRGLTVLRSDGSGGYFYTLEFAECVFDSCTDIVGTGWDVPRGRRLEDCLVKNCVDGPLILSATTVRTTFQDNNALLIVGSGDGIATVQDCVFERNHGDHLFDTVQYFWTSGGIRFSNCRFSGNNATSMIYLESGYVEAEGCLFDRNHGSCVEFCDIHPYYLPPSSLRNCTFVGCDADEGFVCRVTGEDTASDVSVQNCLIAFGLAGEPFACTEAGILGFELSCCNIYGNAEGDWVGCISNQLGTNGNISLDPLFCNPATGGYTLYEESPCAPFTEPNNDSVVQMAA